MFKNHKFGKNRKGTTLVFVKISYRSIKMSINHKFSKNRKGTLVFIKISYKPRQYPYVYKLKNARNSTRIFRYFVNFWKLYFIIFFPLHGISEKTAPFSILHYNIQKKKVLFFLGIYRKSTPFWHSILTNNSWKPFPFLIKMSKNHKFVKNRKGTTLDFITIS